MIEVSGKTKQLGIIGCPVDHSFSPKMHNFLSARMNNDYVYSAWRVEKGEVEAAVNGIRALGIRGVNVTAPHKIEVMNYLDEISEQAKRLGSVNTIVNKNGRLCGYNTDADGFLQSLLSDGITVKGAKILVLGAGGVVKPTVIRLLEEEPKSLTILNRTRERAQSIADEIRDVTGIAVQTKLQDAEFDIVINTTSAGMEPQLDALPTDNIDEIKSLDFITRNTAVVDMIYNPEETLFLKEAKKRGAKTLNGLGMLIYQGLIAYELFTDTKLPKGIAEEVKREVFNR